MSEALKRTRTDSSYSSSSWRPNDLNEALAIKQTLLAKRLFGDVAIRKWLAAGLTVRKIWEITKASEVCRKLIDGEKICWICGYGITEEKGLNPHCEHVMPVAAAVLFASLYNACSPRPENDKFYKAEYLWAHQYCNLIKSDDNLFAVEGEGKNQKIVPNEDVIKTLLNKISSTNERLGGDTLRAIIRNDPYWRGRQLLYLKTICQNVIETLHIESSEDFLATCAANAKTIPHIISSSKYKILFETPLPEKFDHDKNLEEMLLLLVTRTYLQLVRQFFREEKENPTTNEAIKRYMEENQLVYEVSADEQLIVNEPVQFTFNEAEIDAIVKAEPSSSSVGKPASETVPDSPSRPEGRTSVRSTDGSESDNSRRTPVREKVEQSFVSPFSQGTSSSLDQTLASTDPVDETQRENAAGQPMVDAQTQALVEKAGFEEFEPLVRHVFGITEDFDEEYGVSMENLEVVITQFYSDDKLAEFKTKADLGGRAPEKTLVDAIHSVQMEMCTYYYEKFDELGGEFKEPRYRRRYAFITKTLYDKIQFYQKLLTPQAAARRRTYRNKRPKRRYQSIKISSKRHSLS